MEELVLKREYFIINTRIGCVTMIYRKNVLLLTNILYDFLERHVKYDKNSSSLK